MRSHVDRARLAARDEQEGARAVAARAAAAELGGSGGTVAVVLLLLPVLGGRSAVPGTF